MKVTIEIPTLQAELIAADYIAWKTLSDWLKDNPDQFRTPKYRAMLADRDRLDEKVVDRRNPLGMEIMRQIYAQTKDK